MSYIGIDPGRKGAIACLRDGGPIIYDMPSSDREILELFYSLRPYAKLVGLEKQQPYPKQGVNSVFTLGAHYGLLRGFLVVLGLPFIEVHPKTWQAAIFGDAKNLYGSTPKERSLKLAKELFPHIEIGKKDGRADALLIAEYTRRVDKLHQKI